ncbi:hypothetical protein Sjap_010056 [Stephania japonica]|uniref:S-adenosyl-L-methionine-dependent methyltransferase n=1 Tax=Stephania japonica TaxID=461633 RepID=A0AAP0J8P6_9MAGN
MGSVSLKIGDGTARFRRGTLWSSAANLVMLFSVLTTNLFALYAFTYSPTHQSQNQNQNQNHKNISEQLAQIINEISSSEKQLAQMERDLLGYDTIHTSKYPNISPELQLFLSPHPLPLGKDSRSGITEMVSSVGHACDRSKDLLSHYMNYKVGGLCPDDSALAQRLISRGCEPLPRRRCFAPWVTKAGLLLSFPASLWKGVSSKVLRCKSLECLNGTDKYRFVKARSKNDFVVDDVLGLGLGLGGSGRVRRIGLDVGGGSGTFAARMAERNVTVITLAMNVDDAQLNDFIAARGLFPLFMSLDHRLPFYDNVFDLVRAAHALVVDGHGGRVEKLEFLMFDIDRVLRAGGLFWLDNFYCADEEKKLTLTRLIDRFGYKKLKWVVGEKMDPAGSGKSQVYLSAVLQKPVRGGLH